MAQEPNPPKSTGPWVEEARERDRQQEARQRRAREHAAAELAKIRGGEASSVPEDRPSIEALVDERSAALRREWEAKFGSGTSTVQPAPSAPIPDEKSPTDGPEEVPAGESLAEWQARTRREQLARVAAERTADQETVRLRQQERGAAAAAIREQERDLWAAKRAGQQPQQPTAADLDKAWAAHDADMEEKPDTLVQRKVALPPQPPVAQPAASALKKEAVAPAEKPQPPKSSVPKPLSRREQLQRFRDAHERAKKRTAEPAQGAASEKPASPQVPAVSVTKPDNDGPWDPTKPPPNYKYYGR